MNRKIKRFLQAITFGTLIGSSLFPFRGDFSPRTNYTSSREQYTEKVVAAHRGGIETYRENTLDAFKHLKNTGAEMAELDIRKTSDGEFILYHDSKIGGENISSLPYERIQEIAKSQGYSVPTLNEALRVLRDQKKGVIADLKIKGDEEKILGQLKKYLPNNQFNISSPSVDSLKRVKELDKNVKTIYLMSTGFPHWTDWVRRQTGVVPWRQIKEANADYVSVSGSDLNSNFYTNASKGNLGVFVYGVNDPVELKKVFGEKSVAGVIPDKPTLATKVRDEKISVEASQPTHTSKNLEKIISPAIIFSIVLLSIFLLSSKFTGYTIINSAEQSTNIFIGLFLIIGLIIFFLSLNFKNPK